MDIMQIKCFEAVLNTGNFTEAGEILYLSQSAVSKKINALEQEMGVSLLIRNGKRFTVSPAGRMLMSDFVEILESYHRLMMKLDKIKLDNHATSQPCLSIVGVPLMVRYNIISYVDQFTKLHPEIQTRIEEADAPRVLNLLKYGDYDLAFCADINLDHKHYNVQSLQSERFMIGVSRKNSLAARGSVKLKELEHHRFILNRSESMLDSICIDACMASGFTPDVALYTSRPEVAFEYLRYYPDCAYIGLKTTLETEPAVFHRAIRLEDSPVFNLVLAWRKDKPIHMFTRLFLQWLVKNFNIPRAQAVHN